MRALKHHLSLLFALATALLLAACSGGSPEDVAKKFISESYKGNADAVIEMIYIPEKEAKSPGTQEMISGKMKAAVDQQMKIAEKFGGVDEITAEPAKINDSGKEKTANVTVTIRFKNGNTDKDLVKLIETKKGWKVGGL